MTCRYAKGELDLFQCISLCEAKNNATWPTGRITESYRRLEYHKSVFSGHSFHSSCLAECHVKSTFFLPHGENNAQWLRSIRSWKYKPTSLSWSVSINRPSKSIWILICKISCRHPDRGRNCLVGKTNILSLSPETETRRDAWSEVRPPLKPYLMPSPCVMESMTRLSVRS